MTPKKPVLIQRETAKDRTTIVAEFQVLNPNALFDYWTKPELLKKWCPPEVELQPRKGGAYHFSWPKQSWHLRGKFTEFQRGKALEIHVEMGP